MKEVLNSGDNAERGIYLSTGSSGWIYNAIISSVKRGIVIYGGSMTYINNFNITEEVGISVSASKFLKYDNDGNGLGIIKILQIELSGLDGVFTNWEMVDWKLVILLVEGD